ncbi:zinc finger, CCHC-type containing protein [Tanacetum coccineum]
MEGKKPRDLKNKSFDSIQKMFDRAFKRVNTFVDFRTDLVEGSSKRAGEELEQESTKKQKVDEDKDTAELQSLMEVIPDEEDVAIDAIPLATKSPKIVDWKIHKEGKKSYYQIMRADRKFQMYRIFSHMLKSFSREDLEDFYKLLKAKYESTRPVEDLDLLLWGDLKTIFEPHVKDTVWRNQQDYKVLEWKLYDSCGVHSLRMQHVYIYMLVEKRYPLTPSTITDMLNKKLQYKVNAAEGVNAASEEVSTAELRHLVGYAEHSKDFRFYVIEPYESFSINSIIESKDAIFDENRFSSVPRLSYRSLKDGIEDIGGSVVSKEVTTKVVQQPEPELRKSKRNRTPKNFGPEFQLYLIEGTRDAVLDDLPLGCKWIFKRKLKVDETIKKVKSRLVIQGFRQKSRINYFDTYAPIARISTIRLMIAMTSFHNLIIHQMDVKATFLNGKLEEEVDLTNEFLSLRFSMKDTGEVDVILGIKIKHESNGIAISPSYYIEKVLKKFNYFDCTPVSTPIATSKKLRPNNGQTISQLKYSRVISCLMYAMTCTRPDIAFAVGKLSRLTYTGYPLALEGYTDASWNSNTEDNSSTSGWVFLLGGGAISWASKKQTCITAPISIRCDSAATLTKAYSQMYNEKSRHLDVRHNMIRELIRYGVVSIKFVRSQQNLADHLTKGLARDLVIKSAEGMGLKSN